VKGALSALTALACALAACAGPAPTGRPAAPAQPVLRRAEHGLELHRWSVRNDPRALAAALLEFESRPVALAPATRESLRAGGIRVLAVRADDIPRLRALLPAVGEIQRQWLGEAPAWSDILSSPEWRSPRSCALDQDVVTLEPGRLRLLLRTWIEPAPDGSARVRIELAPQHVARSQPPATLNPPRPATAAAAGHVFDALVVTFAASEPGEAILLVPEGPLVRWAVEASDANLPPATDPPGPRFPRAPTPGELLLAGGPVDEPAVASRALVLLVPRVPERYSLFAPAGPVR
jgi:hypothetical protein